MLIPVNTTAAPIDADGASQLLVINSSGGPVAIDYDEDVDTTTGFLLFSSNQVRVPATRNGVALHAIADVDGYEVRILPLA